MKAVNTKSKPKCDPVRKALLAKVHIAVKDLALPDFVYDDIKRGRYGKESAADLTVPQLEGLVEYFKSQGWKPKRAKRRAQSAGQGQAEKLRARAREIARAIDNGEKRLQGLCFKICGLPLAWCHDVDKLKRLLVALNKIARQEMDG